MYEKFIKQNNRLKECHSQGDYQVFYELQHHGIDYGHVYFTQVYTDVSDWSRFCSTLNKRCRELLIKCDGWLIPGRMVYYQLIGELLSKRQEPVNG